MVSYTQNHIHDIIVIGGGLMGSSAAWHLSGQGKDVTLIEQQDSAYTFGSSFGEARITRSLGTKNDIFSYLNNRTVSEVQKLISFLNEKDASEDHQMEDVYSTSPVTYIYYESWKNTVESLVNDQKDPIEYAASGPKAAQKFGLSLPDSAMVIREKKEYSGTINPAVLIKKLHAGIQLQGSSVLYNLRVTNLQKKKDFYELEVVHTQSGEQQTLQCKKVVSAAGPYTGRLLEKIAPQFEELITPQRTFLVFLKIKPQKFASLTAEQKQKIRDFYPYLDFTPDLTYSMIEKTDEDGIPILKVGGHLIRKEINNLDDVWQKELTDDEKEWGLKTTFKHLQRLDIPVETGDLQYVTGYSCVYSMTESEIPLVTAIHDENNQPDPNFVVLGGLSGVGAKGCLAYGLIGANLMLQREESEPMYLRTRKSLGLDRFQSPEDKSAEMTDEDAGETFPWLIQN